MMALDLVPAIHRADWRIHRVLAGETMAEIAHRYAAPVASLTSANQRANGAAPEPGDLMVVPAAAHTRQVASRTAASRGTQRTVATRRTPASKPAHRTRAGAYHTASLASKHRAASN
jgi:murein DD-endopeptidase MepM/ murein hydrolase activator NlpD